MERESPIPDRSEENLPVWMQETNDEAYKKEKTSTEATPLLNEASGGGGGDSKKTEKKNGKQGGKKKKGGGNAFRLFGGGNPKTDDDSGNKNGGRGKTGKKKQRFRDTDTCTTACHDTFVSISTLAILSSLCMFCSQVLPIFFVKVDTLQLCLRVYMSVFCMVFILSELEWTPWIRNNATLRNFVSRGVLYSFIGLIGMEESMAVRWDAVTHHYSGAASVFITVSSWAMIVIGVLYFAMGLLCLHRLRDKIRVRRKEQQEEAEKRLQILMEEGYV